MIGPEIKIVNDTFAVWAAERIRQDNYTGKHRSGLVSKAPWWAHVPQHATEVRRLEAAEAIWCAS